MAHAGGQHLLSARGLVVEYPGVRALDDAQLDVEAGSIHALLGENGAGKSTLIKVLAGIVRPVCGTVQLSGRPYAPRSVHEAEKLGISVVHQEIDLAPNLSIADNIGLGRQPLRWGMIDRHRLRETAARTLERLGIQVDVGMRVDACSLAMQQMVAIARGLAIDARLLVLDEPTSSLDRGEVEILFAVLRRLREQGLGIVLVTHFLDQVYAVTDEITVLRNGSTVLREKTSDLTRTRLISAMTGRTFAAAATATTPTESSRSADSLLKARGLAKARELEPVDVDVRAGETLGVAGLLGSGRSELAHLLAGASVRDAGTVEVGSHALAPGDFDGAIAAGIALVPEDRKGQGLALELSVEENILLAMQARRGVLRRIPAAEAATIAEHYIEKLGIKTPLRSTPVSALSGGNQQKVLLARWLAMQPRVLILDEPCRGVDVGAKAEIESLIARLTAEGIASVLICAELDDVCRLSQRVMVMRDRRKAGELAGADSTEQQVLQMIAGLDRGRA